MGLRGRYQAGGGKSKEGQRREREREEEPEKCGEMQKNKNPKWGRRQKKGNEAKRERKNLDAERKRKGGEENQLVFGYLQRTSVSDGLRGRGC